MAANEGRQWTVGELARAAGITVRALHHYDYIGLLVPSVRSSAGHRRYTPDDVRRLYRILALRRLGLDLRAIGSLLAANDRSSLLETTRLHLAQVQRDIRLGEELRDRLARIIDVLERSDEPSPDQLIDAMEMISMTVRLTRIYTKLGDAGQTQLTDGSWVSKADASLEAGDLEELNAQIGVVLADGDLPEREAGWLRRIQNELFDVGADLAAPSASPEPRSRLRVTADYVDRLEQACDEANTTLDPLDSFLLPRGSRAAAQLHVCRTVCRRAERRVVAMDEANPEIVRYLNRLSDLLFIMSRSVNGAQEALWRPGGHEAE